MLEFLARFATTLEELKEKSGDPARLVIRLFDEEAMFKSLDASPPIRLSDDALE